MKTDGITIGKHSVTRNLVEPLFHLRKDVTAALMIFAIGFAPISALALALMQVFSLPIATVLMVVPALVVSAVLIWQDGRLGNLMLRGFFFGIIAVTVYDCVRIPFTLLGWIGDFIPKIGIMLVGEGEAHLVVGYLWRYLGNGGGMGMAFVCGFVLLKDRFSLVKNCGAMMGGLIFGCLVWACLIATLLLSPNGEEVMFVITPVTLLISGIGHMVFGCTLGFLVRKRFSGSAFRN